jgi:cytochrome c oxidase subunit 3
MTNSFNNLSNAQATRYLFQFFPSHLVANSPWPFYISFVLLGSAIGAVMSFHGFPYGGALLSFNLFLTTAAMALWFRDIIIEGTFLGHHTKKVVRGFVMGIALFILSEVMAFFSVFWAFFHSSLSPAIEIGGAWPPLGIETLNPWGVPLLNTALLLSSGAFITFGHHGLIGGSRSSSIDGTLATIFLALLFTSFQWIEYADSSFSMADSIYGTTFFSSTGLHGIHVIIVTIFISVGFWRILSYHLTRKHHIGYESSIMYWHFVDIVWLFLFVVIYYWGSN